MGQVLLDECVELGGVGFEAVHLVDRGSCAPKVERQPREQLQIGEGRQRGGDVFFLFFVVVLRRRGVIGRWVFVGLDLRLGFCRRFGLGRSNLRCGLGLVGLAAGQQSQSERETSVQCGHGELPVDQTRGAMSKQISPSSVSPSQTVLHPSHGPVSSEL